MMTWVTLTLTLALSTLLTSTTATPHAFTKRESGLKCESLDKCISYYTTGSASCASGYDFTNLEAAGDPLGQHCERACTDSEKKQCAASQCSFYREQCALYPGSSICAKAISFCGIPVKMPKKSCNQDNMGQPVKYDDATGTCDFDNTPRVEKKLVYDFGEGVNSLRLFMTCEPLTIKGAKSVDNAVLNGIDGDYCVDFPYPDFYNSPDTYRSFYKCNGVDRNRFDEIEKAGKAACEAAEYPGSKKPVFEASRS